MKDILDFPQGANGDAGPPVRRKLVLFFVLIMRILLRDIFHRIDNQMYSRPAT